MIPYVQFLKKEICLTQEQSNGADLIALNSEKSKNADTQGTKFERLWNLFEEPIYGARGWCDASVDNVVKSLQNCDVDHAEVIPANEPPFIGRELFL